jgi:glycosyltransferase-like protein
VTSVGLFTYSTKPRGSVVHACCLAEALTTRGHDVTLYALSKAGDRLYRELPCDVRYLAAAPAPEDADALIAQRIREVADGVARLRPRHDVYHAEDCLVASGLLSLRASHGLSPIVRTLHHLEHFDSPYLQACQRRSILEADATLCVSQVSQRDVRRELGRDCPIIGNGVDVSRFAPDEELASWTRSRFGLPEQAMLVLSVGGVEPRKNSLRSLEAMAEVLRRHPNAHWLIAGGSSIWEHERYRGEFRQRLSVMEPSLRARIVELGAVSERELTGLYQSSQILLCPSVQEGFGLCVLEALAARTAVVVSAAEPFTEYLNEDVACFVEADSSAGIASVMEGLMSDPTRAVRLATHGAEHARKFSWEHVAREHERLYGRLLERVLPPIMTPVCEEPAHA